MAKRIAFIGTGIMGAPMAVNLLRAEYSVACYNRTPAKAKPVHDAGGAICDTPAQAASAADCIITMVTDGPDVEAVLFGADGAFQTAREGTLCIDMSTISPALTRDFAARGAARGIHMLDAPVTGGQPGAINGTLSIMVGGDREDFEAARPVLAAMGKKITYCGEHGAGQSVKLCNQICGAMNLLGVCEALILGQKMGIAPETIIEVIGAGAGTSWAMQNLAPKIISGDFAPGFMIDTQQKDMRLVAEAAAGAGVPLLGASLAQQLWRSAQTYGCGEEGIQAMFKVVQQLANFEGGTTDLMQ
ncbi:MAG TPA: NAD(P)-dependent oxidoreductase [Abditibacteriaceae bacterium]|nr:NAD(P)-dependent oxidoreductase [Abditibacteriaceae bacterium]